MPSSSNFDAEFDAAVQAASKRLYKTKYRPRQPKPLSKSQQLYQDDLAHKQERDSYISRRIKKSFPPHGLFQGTITEYDPKTDNYAIAYDDNDMDVLWPRISHRRIPVCCTMASRNHNDTLHKCATLEAITDTSSIH